MISVVISALNEEQNLRSAVESALAAGQASGRAIEIIIVNDGSTDRTGPLAEEIARDNPEVKVVHHSGNLGMGAAFLQGIRIARYDWLTFFPGDNLVSVSTLRRMIENTGKADVILAYTVNTEMRSRLRRIVSSLFGLVYLNLFDLPLRYINATPVYHVPTLRQMSLRCFRYSFPSEVTIKLLRSGSSFMELSGYINPHSLGKRKSSALKLINLFEVAKNFILLCYEIFIQDRAKYAQELRRVIPPCDL